MLRSDQTIRPLVLAALRNDIEVARRMLDDTPFDGHLMTYLALAARLAGTTDDRSALDAWPTYATRMGPTFRQALATRAREGIRDLDHTRGKRLAKALHVTQDFHIFRVLAADVIGSPHSDLLEPIDDWIEHARTTSIDDACAQELDYLNAEFPVPNYKLRLTCVSSPMGPTRLEQLRPRLRAPRTLEFTWAEAEKAATEEQDYRESFGQRERPQNAWEVATLDDGLAPLALRQAMFVPLARLDLGGSLGRVCVARSLTADWVLQFNVTNATGTPPDVRLLRVGRVAATQSRQYDGIWELNLSDMPRPMRADVLCQPTAILFAPGVRCVLQAEQP